MRAIRSRLVLATVVLGLALVFPSLAMAQTSAGLTVTGLGEATRPADTAIVALTVGSESMMMGPFPSLPQGQTAEDLLGPIADALVGEGVDEGTITIISGPDAMSAMSMFGPPLAVIRFELSDPTATSITAAVDAATASATDNRLYITGMTRQFLSDDCDTLRRDAREAAVANAREQADTMAQLAGVTTGDVVAVRDVPIGTEPGFAMYGPPLVSGACLPFETSTVLPESYGATVNDPSEEPMVTAYAQVEMTFATSGSEEATPAG